MTGRAKAALAVGLALATIRAGSSVAAMGGPLDKETFLEALNSGDEGAEKLLRLHFRGVIEGLEAANASLLRRGDAPLYCLPIGTLVHPEWLIDATKRYYDRFDNIPEAMPVAVVATNVLQDGYPCPAAIDHPGRREAR